MARWIGIVSGKGGVGKTVSTALLGLSLARLGKKVLVVDGCPGRRNLDLALGTQNQLVNHFGDVIAGHCAPQDAVVSLWKEPNLLLLTAPQICEEDAFSPEEFEKILRGMEGAFDFILIDCPGGVGRWTVAVAQMCSRVLVATMPEVMSARDAQRMVSLLDSAAESKLFMLITRVRVDSVKKNDMIDMDTLLQMVAVPIIGAVPEDEEIQRAIHRGGLGLLDKNSYAVQAYHNIARRLLGEKVPILEQRGKPLFRMK